MTKPTPNGRWWVVEPCLCQHCGHRVIHRQWAEYMESVGQPPCSQCGGEMVWDTESDKGNWGWIDGPLVVYDEVAV